MNMHKVSFILNDRIKSSGREYKLTNEFKNLQTNEERVLFTLRIMSEFDVTPKVTGLPKDIEKSETLRKKGNEIFVKDSFNNSLCIEALKLYTKSIAFAPYPSQQLALAFANRSATLYMLGLFKECVQDIERALVLEYPDHLRPKLYIRKTQALLSMGSSIAEVNASFNLTQFWIDKVSVSDSSKNAFQVRLNNLYEKIKNLEVKSQEPSQTESPLPSVESQNDEIVCASDAIALKYNNENGRHIVATRDIHPGEVIAVEKPYALLLVQDKILTHCSNCLEVCWANIPCKFCSYAMYCSEECRDIEWKKSHDVECSVFPALIEYSFFNLDLFSVRLIVLAIREAGGIQELKAMLKEVDKCDDPRKKGFSKDGKLHSDKYIAVYSLASNLEKRTPPDLFTRSLDSCFILYFLATRSKLFGIKLSEDLRILLRRNDVKFIGNLLLNHQQIIPTNIHSFSEEHCMAPVERGVAAMPFFSLFNHSCYPNVLRHSRPKHIVMYVIYPIKKGEQVLDNYGRHHAMMVKLERQQKLFEQYYFTCACRACEEDWPLYQNLKSYKDLMENDEVKAKIATALQRFQTCVILAKQSVIVDKSRIIQDLIMMINVLYEHAPIPCVEINNVIETLKRVYDLNGNKFELPKLVSL